ncbi:hypothetical protein [Nonomuraea sp. NPDC050202]|uniref:hypothetical protein n=1 Tax=Nonomuraea sp. NPDC050202 TaxID=3155035 RepID=UPI0033F7F947
MPYITVGKENSASVDLSYEDHRTGQPVEIEGAPHGLLWTHAAEVGQALLGFVK